MRTILRSTVLATVLLAAFPSVQAATQSYSFNGTMESGHHSGQAFSGMFSFDDAMLSNTGEEYLGVGSLTMNFLGTPWNLTHLEVGAIAEVKFYEGAFAGLSYSATQGTTGFSAIPGTANTSDAFVAYDTSLGISGTGSINYAPVPEPEAYAMLLAGLGLMSLAARRRNKLH